MLGFATIYRLEMVLSRNPVDASIREQKIIMFFI